MHKKRKPKQVSIKKVSIKETWLAEPNPNDSNEYIQSVRFDQVSHKSYNCSHKSYNTVVHPPNLHIYKRQLKSKYFLSLVAYKNQSDEKQNFYVKNYYIESEGANF